MKQTIFYIGFALATWGCTQQGEWTEGDPEGRVPVTLEATLSATVQTRAGTEIPLESGAIGLFRTNANNYEALTNVRYTYDETAGQWLPEDANDLTKAVYVDHRNATLYAYYPYTDGVTSSIFDLSLQRYNPAHDWCGTGALTGVSNRNATLKFALTPGHARLTLQLLNYNLPPCVVSSVTIESVSGTYVTDGTVDFGVAPVAVTSGSGTTASFSFPLADTDTITTKGIGSGQTDRTVDMLWVPQIFAGDMKITLVFHFSGESVTVTPELNNTVTVTIPQSSLGSLQGGTQYVLPLLIKGATVSFLDLVPDFTVTTYDPFGENNLTSYTAKPALVNGVSVATGNVYSYTNNLVAPSRNPWYEFTYRTGKTGNITGQKLTFSQETVQNDDPCQHVGPNWVTPDKEQFERLIGAVKTSKSDNDGGLGTVSGCWFGSTSYNASLNPPTGVFLANGDYWTSTAGYYVTVSGATVTLRSNGTVTATKNVRCIEKEETI